MTGDNGYDAYRGDLNTKCVTLAEVLGSSGYRTYMPGNGTLPNILVLKGQITTGRCSEGSIGSMGPLSELVVSGIRRRYVETMRLSLR